MDEMLTRRETIDHSLQARERCVVGREMVFLYHFRLANERSEFITAPNTWGEYRRVFPETDSDRSSKNYYFLRYYRLRRDGGTKGSRFSESTAVLWSFLDDLWSVDAGKYVAFSWVFDIKNRVRGMTLGFDCDCYHYNDQAQMFDVKIVGVVVKFNSHYFHIIDQNN